jgi:Flp pilus assembly protein TadD
LREAQRLAPLDPDHLANLARLDQFWSKSSDPSKLAEAVRYAGEASQLSPHSVELLDEWAILLTDQGNYALAQDKASLAAKLDPSFAQTHVVLGDIYLERQSPLKALAEHAEALRLDPNSLADGNFDHRINLYVQQKQGPALAETYRRLIGSNADRSTRMAYAFVASKVGQLSVAVEQYQELVRADSSDWQANRNLAIAYLQSGDRANARTAAEAALATAPADQRASIQSFLTGLASG